MLLAIIYSDFFITGWTLFFIVMHDYIFENMNGGIQMLNFEEELKNYEPSLEVEEAESSIYNRDLTDVTDIIAEILREQK